MKGQSCVRKGGGKEDERTRKGRKDKYDMKKRERRKQEKKGKERGRGSSASHSGRGKENEGRGVFCGLELIFEHIGIASGPIATQCFVHFPDSK